MGLTPDSADLTPPSPEQERVVAALRGALGTAVRGERCFRGQLSIWVDRPSVAQALRFLRTDPDLRFEFLTDITSVDRWNERGAGEARFEVVYTLTSPTSGRRVLVKTEVDDGQTVPSATAIWTGANFMEREVYDLMGIVFEGHPDLERILTPDGWMGHPLRKDHPTRTDQFPNVEN